MPLGRTLRSLSALLLVVLAASCESVLGVDFNDAYLVDAGKAGDGSGPGRGSSSGSGSGSSGSGSGSSHGSSSGTGSGGTGSGSSSGSGSGSSTGTGSGSGSSTGSGTGSVGCTPTVLASNQDDPAGIASDGTNVYWGDYHGLVLSCPVSGCVGGVPTTLATGQSPIAMLVDAHNVYWANGGSTPPQ